ncbi:MAG: type II toxin-antitoxin system VapC family toxin [Gammaproteobacteria bacterium]|nr:type II toxin-antitoxin system VapC family toxin [Gammaproteobacteria bacterium]
MRVLLDTSVLILAMNDDPKLSNAARSEIQQAAIVYVSAASIWEIGIKAGIGKLKINLDRLIPCLQEAGFEQLTVTWEHAKAVSDLPEYHKDPFDRMLIAQAQTEPLRLLTQDKTLLQYSDLVTLI